MTSITVCWPDNSLSEAQFITQPSPPTALLLNSSSSSSSMWCSNIYTEDTCYKGILPGGSDGKESACNAGGLGSIPESGRSGEENGNPLQSSWLENPMDRGAWRATVLGVAKSRTRQRLTLSLHLLQTRFCAESCKSRISFFKDWFP